ncbi:YiiX family permuted papain-like enzyme [Aurantibacter sp.]|uniref:YiiX family permuted papain-like enzyme n=1 Tax=Aurantibacter sp. TaxID=2807103 RepID=UPI0035C85D37
MKKIIFTILALGILAFGLYWSIEFFQFAKGVKADTPKFVEQFLKNEIQNGDIIFQTSKSSQSKAIQLATNSKYSHMGIIYKIDNQFYVYEAVQPVKLTFLKNWINRGKNRHYVIKRLKNSAKILTPETLVKMRQVGDKYKGKNYDLYFEWSDDKIYCSELVWKIYKEGGNIEIGKLEELSDFDLNHKVVKQKMKERYGDNIPMGEKVISPAQMFNSNKLKTVFKNH